jgi:hypothetical protein
MGKLGFVGTGAIAEAIATGLCTSGAPPTSVVLSPRSAERSARLAAAHPALCTVATSNQAVVDQADIVFVCVLPAQLEAVLAELVRAPPALFPAYPALASLSPSHASAERPCAGLLLACCWPAAGLLLACRGGALRCARAASCELRARAARAAPLAPPWP